MDDRPRRQEEDGRLARAVDLVVQAYAVALGIAGAVRVPCPGLLATGLSHRDIHRSIQSSSSRCPVSMPPSRPTMMPMLNVITSDTSAPRQFCPLRDRMEPRSAWPS